MKKYLVIFLLIIAAVGLSLVLVPDAREIALMQFRDKEFDKARASYEQRLAEGNLTVDVVSALTNLHLQSGDVDKAIEIMEAFIQKNPDNLLAHQELGKLYQYAQRPDDYLANLEKINQIQQSTASLKTMNEMYAASQQYDKQEPALEALVGTKDARQPQNYRNLARLQSSQKKFVEAIATYQEFWNVYPDVFKMEDLEVLMALQVDQDNLQGAFESAKKYAQKNPPLKDVARLVNIIHYRGNPEMALELLAPYEGQIAQSPDLGLEKTYILLAQGKSAEAYDMLKWLDGVMALPAPLQREYISMLVMRGEYEQAKTRLESLDIAALPEIEIASLVELALFNPKAELLPALNKRIAAVPEVQNFAVLQAALAVANNQSDWSV